MSHLTGSHMAAEARNRKRDNTMRDCVARSDLAQTAASSMPQSVEQKSGRSI